MSSRILVFGACSAIAQAVARRYADHGASLYLVARDESALELVAADVRTRGAAHVQTKVLDATDYDAHAEFAVEAAECFGGFDCVLIAHGVLPDQAKCEQDWSVARESLETNVLSVMSLLTHFARIAEERDIRGFAVLGSVAGDRGRQSNYIYGTAKGALDVFLSGLRNRLHKRGIFVLNVKLGFVDTPMTAHLKKGALFSQPETVARSIVRAITAKKDVTYVPRIWRLIMCLIRSVPEWVFKRLGL